MGARLEVRRVGYQVTNQLALQLRELRPGIAGHRLAALCAWLIADEVVVDEFHRIAGQAEQCLVGLEGLAGHAFPELFESRCRGVLETDSRVWRPQAGSQGRADIGRQVLRIKGDARASAL